MGQNLPEDEYLDIVNEADEVVGKELRSVFYRDHRSDFRVVNALITNSRGQLWIPRRTESKRIFPLCLDMSIGGHVESGESYDDAFRREAAEEVNVDTSATDYRILGHLTPHEHGTSAFMQVYEIPVDEDPDYNRENFLEFFWMTPKETLARIERGDKAKNDLPRLIRHFYVSTPKP